MTASTTDYATLSPCPPTHRRLGYPRTRARTHRFVTYHFADPLAPILLSRTPSDPQLTELDAAYRNDIIDNTATNIRHGQRFGQLPADLDPDSAAAYVIGGLCSGISQQLRANPTPDAEQATQTLWRFTAAALGATNPLT